MFRLSIRISIGILFIITGILKSINLESFLYALNALNGIPNTLVSHLVYVIPAFEVFIGILLLFNIPYSIHIACVMNASFLIIIGLNYFDGNVGVDCGCFGDLLTSEINFATLTRQFLIFSANAYLIFLPNNIIKLNKRVCP